MDVSVIIVNFNTCAMTIECIDSIYQHTHGISFEVIVVDNNSTDSSNQVLSIDKRIKYIYLQKNLGFGKANNIGIHQAIGRNIFFLNSDTLLINNAIKILSDYLDKNLSVGAVGGNLFSSSLNPVHSFQRTSPLLFEIDNLIRGCISKILYGKNIDFNHSDKPLKVKCIVGADLMIRKSIINNIGGFDNRFFMYCEETELLHRVKKARYGIESIPDAKIIHLEGQSFSSDRQIDRIVLFRHSLQIYCNLHFNKFYFSIVNLIWNMNIASRIAYYSLMKSDKKEYWKKIRSRVKIQ